MFHDLLVHLETSTAGSKSSSSSIVSPSSSPRKLGFFPAKASNSSSKKILAHGQEVIGSVSTKKGPNHRTSDWHLLETVPIRIILIRTGITCG